MLDILERMRESEEAADQARTHAGRDVQLSRARAFDEVYTELKGIGYDKAPF